MPETVDYDEGLGVILVRSFGVVSAEEMEASVGRVARLSAEMGSVKVLVDAEHLEAMPQAGDLFFLAATFPRSARLAVVISRHREVRGDLRFAENAARNRGVDLRLFSTRSEALDWLKG
jgi:hypothetical protein